MKFDRIKMKRKELHHLLKRGTKHELINNQMIVYAAFGSNKGEKGIELYRYDYIPLLSSDIKVKLSGLFENSSILKQLLNSFEFLYEVQQRQDCMKIYFERFWSEGNENKKHFLEKEISIVKRRTMDIHTYPIFERINESDLEDKNVYSHIDNLMLYQEDNNIEDINNLIYEDFNLLKHSSLYQQILNSISNIIYFRFLNYLTVELNQLIKEAEKGNIINQSSSYENIKKAVRKPKTLFDIWIPELDKFGNKRQYKEHIDFLKKTILKTDSSFVTEIDNKLFWNTSQFGSQQYMAGFIYTCIKNKWIADKYSAPELIAILTNTFNTNANVKSFKSISSSPPKLQYLQPFSKLPSNSNRNHQNH